MKLNLLIIAMLMLGCGKKVETVKPIRKTITESVYASGIVKSQNQYNVYATVSGILQEVVVAENDLVKKGSPLFIIANEPQKLLEENALLTSNYNALDYNKGKLNEAQSIVNLAKQKMDNDELMLKRQQNLWNQSIGTKVELEQKQLAFENSKVNYHSALQKYNDLSTQLSLIAQQSKNNLRISSNSTNDFIVKSNINGKVYQININKGELVTPQVPLAIIGDDQTYILEMQVDEYDIVSVELGMKVMLVLNSYKDSVFSAKVSKINPIMNAQSKTFTVEATFIDQPSLLYPSISLEANIIVNSKENALLIPRIYLLNDSIVMLGSGKPRIVKTGLKDYQMVEIVSGLDENDELSLPQK